jgi:hypothetical protein
MFSILEMKGYIADVLFTYYGLMQMVDFFQFRFHHFVALLPMTDIVPTELGVINDSNNSVEMTDASWEVPFQGKLSSLEVRGMTCANNQHINRLFFNPVIIVQTK